jgi:hypothetical protein
MAHARRAITFDTPEVLTLLRSLHCMKSREDYSTLDGRQLSRATDVCFGSNSTELAKARISFLSAMPPIATDPVCHIELSEVP